MKVLILGDPHGIVPRQIKTSQFDAIICTGDFVPDGNLRKLIFSAIKKGIDWRTTIPAKKLRAIKQKDKLAGRAVLSWLASTKLPVYFILGNWDVMDGEVFHHKSLPSNLYDCDGKLIVTNQFCIIGYGKTFGPELPAGRTTAAMRKEFARMLAGYSKVLARARKTKLPIILLTHNPPFDTTLDMVRNKTSPAYGKHVGSQLVRKLIDKYHPELCLCGHMHENQGKTMIGKTVCVNAGCLSEKKIYCLLVGE